MADPLSLLKGVPTAADIEREIAQRDGHKMTAFFPESGPYRRDLYAKHLAFMAAGAQHRERMLLAGNQVGKTEVGAYEMTCHLTGRYPSWWRGRRFDSGNVQAWAAGDTTKTVRAILQVKLMGAPGQQGTGMIPRESIEHVSRAAVPGALDQVWIKHVAGNTSYLEFKSYDQRREAFQGTSMHVIWLDEEPPEDIYTECLLRTITTNGILYTTFTPLQGVTPLILNFMADAGAAGG